MYRTSDVKDKGFLVGLGVFVLDLTHSLQQRDWGLLQSWFTTLRMRCMWQGGNLEHSDSSTFDLCCFNPCLIAALVFTKVYSCAATSSSSAFTVTSLDPLVTTPASSSMLLVLHITSRGRLTCR